MQQAASIAPSNTTQLDSIYSSLEKDFLQQQPEIPLWYNGIWFQGNTQYWTNYPSSTSSDQNIPAMWAGYLGAMTTVLAPGAADAGRRPRADPALLVQLSNPLVGPAAARPARPGAPAAGEAGREGR